jgi:hypothetical protein
MPRRRSVLAVCSFFPADSLIEETVAVLGATTDLYLVPVERGVPIPAVAEPYLAHRKLGTDAAWFEPCKKWRSVERVLDRVRIDDYDWAFFPDDDLEYGDAGFLDRFIDLLEAHDVALAQPALTADSFHTYDLCVRRDDTRLRLTNFVEVMAPCFRRDCLVRLRETLASDISPMGYGFDLHWAYACADAGFRMAIVDETPVAHRFRPTGKHYGGDDLHGQGLAYGRRFPRILLHEMAELGRIPRS